MRKFIFLLLLALVSSCQNDKKINSNLIDNPLTIDGLSKNIKVPQISINSPVFDFGEVNEGEKFPKEPILPNQQSEIIVVFNTKGKFGKQNKTITLLTNTVPRAKVLTIKGYINKQ